MFLDANRHKNILNMVPSPLESREKQLPGSNKKCASDSDIKVQIWHVMKRSSFIILLCLAIYLLGYFNFSIAWLVTPLLLILFRQEWKKEKQLRLLTAREASVTNEKDMIESRIKIADMPSWVFFPDKVTMLIHNMYLIKWI